MNPPTCKKTPKNCIKHPMPSHTYMDSFHLDQCVTLGAYRAGRGWKGKTAGATGKPSRSPCLLHACPVRFSSKVINNSKAYLRHEIQRSNLTLHIPQDTCNCNIHPTGGRAQVLTSFPQKKKNSKKILLRLICHHQKLFLPGNCKWK